jgi:hypothetical protein
MLAHLMSRITCRRVQRTVVSLQSRRQLQHLLTGAVRVQAHRLCVASRLLPHPPERATLYEYRCHVHDGKSAVGTAHRAQR